jgi:uncharacterized membrane protein YbhN (UPF0104 family)
MKKALLATLEWVLGGALAWLVLGKVAWSEAVDGILLVHWDVAVLAVAAIFYSDYLKSYRWKLLLPGEQVSPSRLFLVRNAGSGISSVSPIRVMGEITQIAMLGQQDGIRAAKVTASIVLSGIFDLVVTLNILALGLFLLPPLADYRHLVIGFWATAAGLFVLTPLLVGRLGRCRPLRRSRFARETLEALSVVHSQKGVVLACLALTLGGWLFIGIAAWLIAEAMGIGLTIRTVTVLIVAVLRGAGFTPAPTGMVGVYEFVTVSTLALFTVDPAIAVSFALVTHAVIYLPRIVLEACVLLVDRAAFAHAITSVMEPLQQLRFSRKLGA